MTSITGVPPSQPTRLGLAGAVTQPAVDHATGAGARSGAHRPRPTVGAAAVIAGTLAIVAVAFTLDPRAPAGEEWLITALLATVGTAGGILARRFGGHGLRVTPRWDVHTAWVLPGALLLPPAGVAFLAAVVVALGLARTDHPLTWRIATGSVSVSCLFVATMAAGHVADSLLDSAIVVGALLTAGIVLGVPTSLAVDRIAAHAVWLDARWAAVEVGAAVTGVIIAAAIRTDPWFALLSLAPAMFVAFAVRWPELDRTARSDPKTGLSNAAHWENQSRLLLLVARSRRVTTAVLMIDLDLFKVVNDTYGHLVGDRVLTATAEALRSLCRETDALGRFGGEEFAVTAIDRDAADVAALAEEVRRRIGAIDYRAVRLSDGAEVVFTVTCTVGFAVDPLRHHGLDELLRAADAAMVEGKHAGRDRVVRAATS